MLDYDLTDRAVRDISAARRWYDQASTDLGNRFVDEVLLAIRAARERPHSFPIVQSDKRAVRCRKFPYRVYFEEFRGHIVVLAVYHTSRNPSLWDDPDRQ